MDDRFSTSVYYMLRHHKAIMEGPPIFSFGPCFYEKYGAMHTKKAPNGVVSAEDIASK